MPRLLTESDHEAEVLLAGLKPEVPLQARHPIIRVWKLREAFQAHKPAHLHAIGVSDIINDSTVHTAANRLG